MENMWVVDMEKDVDGTEPPATVQKWPKHCIFRVPPHFKVGNVFNPQMVALGPFHHNDDALCPMEEHKLRAVRHLLRRAGKTLGDLATAVEAVAADLEDAYAKLGDEWRGKNRNKFLKMMIADGCFLLEFMRRAKRREKISDDYSPNDPVFGRHAVEHIGTFVHRDMLLIENQLPLILLRTIVAVEGGPSDDFSVNKLVLDFLGVVHDCKAVVNQKLGLHPLDLYRQSLLMGLSTRRAQPIPNDDQAGGLPTRVARGYQQDGHLHQERGIEVNGLTPKAKPAPPRRSARKLYEAGIRFKIREGGFLVDNIDFQIGRIKGKLLMPKVDLDDSSEYKYRNLMAFEALHDGAGGNDVTAFVLFMRDLIDSEADVELLCKKGVLDHELAAGDRAVVSLLNRLTTDVVKPSMSTLCYVRKDIEKYCIDRSLAGRLRVLFFKSLANFRTSYLSNIWTFIGLLAAIVLLGTDIVQTVFCIKSYDVAKEQLKIEQLKK